MAEDDAPRLAATCPRLRSARIEINEQLSNGSSRYIKHIVVARAPALFMLPCGDAGCQDGGYDITAAVLSAFHRGLSSATGECHCEGMTGNTPCRRSLTFALTAEYA